MRTKGIPKSQRTKKFLFRIPITLLFSILLILVVYYGVFQDYHPRTLSPYETTLADFKLVSGNRMIQSGRIVVLFVGAEACPYCAAESWSIVASLGQYGIWKGLSPIISNKTDSIPSFPEESKAVSRPWAHNQPKTYQEGRPVFCQRCGARQRFENPKFCSNCGSPLKTKMQD